MRRAGKTRAGHNPVTPRDQNSYRDGSDTGAPRRWIDTQLDSASIDADVQMLRSRGVDIAPPGSTAIGGHAISQ